MYQSYTDEIKRIAETVRAALISVEALESKSSVVAVSRESAEQQLLRLHQSFNVGSCSSPLLQDALQLAQCACQGDFASQNKEYKMDAKGANFSVDCIKQLNQIDQDVVRLVESAGQALRALTSVSSDAQSSSNGHTASSHKVNGRLKSEPETSLQAAFKERSVSESSDEDEQAPAPAPPPPPPQTLDERKAAFGDAVTAYFALLSAIDVRLRKQIQALETAQILTPALSSAADPSSQAGDTASSPSADPNNTPASTAPRPFRTDALAPSTQPMARQGTGTSAARAASKPGGPGASSSPALDVGLLNSRNDYVGKEMEAELWEKAASIVAEFESKWKMTRSMDGSIQTGT